MHISPIFPWWLWLVIGMFIWCVITVWEANNKIKEIRNAAEKLNKSSEINMSAKIENGPYQGVGENKGMLIYDNSKHTHITNDEGDKKKDEIEIRLEVYNDISKLMNQAIKETIDFGIIWERKDKLSRKERKEKAFHSQDIFYQYFENHKDYFSPQMRELFEKLAEKLEKSIRDKEVWFDGIKNTQQLIEMKLITANDLQNNDGTESPQNRDWELQEIENKILDEFYKFRESPSHERILIDWEGIEFKVWNPLLSDNVKGGIEITNNKAQDIDNYYVELLEIHQEISENEYIGLYTPRKADLPCMLAWQINNESVYEKISIEIGKSKYLGIAYNKWWMSGIERVSIVGKNFEHPMSNDEIYILEVENSGKINGKSLRPMKHFVRVSLKNNRFVVEEIINELPKR